MFTEKEWFRILELEERIGFRYNDSYFFEFSDKEFKETTEGFNTWICRFNKNRYNNPKNQKEFYQVKKMLDLIEDVKNVVKENHFLRNSIEFFTTDNAEKKEEIYMSEIEEESNVLDYGTKVLLNTWEEMVKDYGVDENGDINYPCSFPQKIRHLAGTIVTIKNVWYPYDDTLFTIEEDDYETNLYPESHIKKIITNHRMIHHVLKKMPESYDYEKTIALLKEELEQLRKENKFLKKSVAFLVSENN